VNQSDGAARFTLDRLFCHARLEEDRAGIFSALATGPAYSRQLAVYQLDDFSLDFKICHCHWSLVIGHWSLVIGHLPLVPDYLVQVANDK
jgi:hypothetical protein